MQVSHYSLTDVGIKRSHNQDALGVSMAPNPDVWKTRGHLFIVADGMGAHAVGELASKIAIDTIQLTYSKLRDLDPESTLRQAITEANQAIHERGTQTKEFEGMGTTVSALALLPEGAIVGHVGDSRCYRLRGPLIEQLSYDHSLHWELARRQNKRPEDLTGIPTNIIVRSLGPDPAVEIDIDGPYSVLEGDRFLLCSDGLSGQVNDSELWTIVSHLPGDEACQFLIDLANLRGGPDNITVILVQAGDPNKSVLGLPLPKESLRVRLGRTLRQVPIPWWFLLTGLGTGAVGYWRLETGGWRLEADLANVIYFSVASVLLLCLSWAGFRYRRKLLRQQPPPPPPPPIHRSQKCSVDLTMIEDLARLEKNLHELASEESWKIDWEDLGKKRALAEETSKAGNLSDALQAYCRALSVLTTALRQRRDKHEVIKPRWKAKQ